MVAAAGLVVALGVWLWVRPPKRELWIAVPALILAAASMLSGLGQQSVQYGDAGWAQVAQQRYVALWEALNGQAWRAREEILSLRGPRAPGPEPFDLDTLDLDSRGVADLETFARLERLVAGSTDGTAVLWLDADGNTSAWAGAGLLHELEPSLVPNRGATFIAGFSAVTLLAIEPLDGQRSRSARAVAGRSLATDVLPFAPPGGESANDYRWSLVAGDSPGEEVASPAVSPAGGAIRLAAPGLPAMLIERRPGLGEVQMLHAPFRRRSWLVVGLAMLALAVMRTVGLLLAPPRQQVPWLAASLLAMGGVTALSSAASLSVEIRLALVTVVALAGLGLRGAAWRLQRRWTMILAGGGSGLLVLGCWLYQRLGVAQDLGGELIAGPEIMALRMVVFGAALGLLGLVAHRPVEGDASSDRWGWLAVCLILAAGSVVDLPWLAIALLMAGGGCAGGWLCGRVLSRNLGSFFVLLLLAVLLSAVAWEVVYRAALRHRLEEHFLVGMSPPDVAEVERLAATIEGFFAHLDLAALTPRPTAGMEYQDLALAVWSRSPLARLDARSALVVTPLDRAAASPSAFSTGVSLTDDYEIDDSEAGVEARIDAWRRSRIEGRVEITAGGEPWGSVSWWFQPRPGFALGEAGRAEEILAALLRGEAAGSEEPTQLPPSVLYALFDEHGVALVSPWEFAVPPPLPESVGNGAGGGVSVTTMDTPAGMARVFSSREADGQEVLYLPLLKPGKALLHLITHANGVLLPLAMATLLALLLALPRAAFRDLLWRTVRSYSKRLILVFSLLLLVPLLLLNLVILRGVERSQLRDRRERGEEALRAAQRAIRERLFNSPTGFDVQTVIADEVLRLPRMIDHEVNLYWGGDFFASSRKELFTAGLLPRRIPGDVFARLALQRYRVASRLNLDYSPPFLELYTPVLSGSDAGGLDLVVSVSLQTQQEEDAAVLAGLRGQSLAYTTALIALLLAVGSRLAADFTRPIQQIVAGTRRIAAGATSLDLAPSDLELAALVEAVDEMALRISEGRHQLLREKALVEGMVENITPGVLSLDAEYRVLMHNRAAAKLLGVQVGDNLLEVARAADRLTPIADLLRAAPSRGAASANPGFSAAGSTQGAPARTTIRLAGEDRDSQKEWTVVSVPLPVSLPGQAAPGSLLVVEDVTEMLQGQRLAAWAEMARIIAHEIKNPLTPVRLSAEHMRQVYHAGSDQFPEIFERCTTNILTQVDELQQIASEFSTYAHIPRIDLSVGDLRAAMEQLIEAYLAAPPEGVEVLFEATEEPLMVRFDGRLLGRAVRNLLENAVRASLGGGQVVLRLAAEGGRARISVKDRGPGVPSEQLGRIFDPYFSTHQTGTGLGLPIARRIAEEHGGGISARNREKGGLVVEIDMPLLREAP